MAPRVPAGMRLASTGSVTNRMVAGVAIACLAFQAAIAGAQTRFDAVDESGINGIPGLRIITVRDTLLKRCYLVFLGEPMPPAGARRAATTADVERARSARDSRLSQLAHTFEQAQSSSVGGVPGTSLPDPLLYNWQANAVQIEFALSVLEQQFARLEQELDRIAGSPRMALTAMPVSCAPEGRAAP